MRLKVIAAHDPNLVIGKDGGLPWHYSEDLKFFKNTTMGGVLLMGRRVFESLNEKPLPGRRNIVLSRTKTYTNVECYPSVEQALAAVDEDEIFVIGGAVLYEELLPKADELIITLIKKEYEGDTFFPEYRQDIGHIWQETSRAETDELVFITYKRMR